MKYTNYQPTPVYSSDYQPLMPCHPARARKLLVAGRAAPHHVRGIFGIRLLDRTRAASAVQDVALNIDPNADTSGFAAVTDDKHGQRTVLAAVELKHRARAIKATLAARASYRRTRRGRLRYRSPRFNNRTRPAGWLAPSMQSLKDDTMRVVNTMRLMYPVTSIKLEFNKFDPQLMADPTISGIEYQHGTLHGWQVRAYVMERDHSRCVYCGVAKAKLELDHVRPRAIGSDRVDNLVACCRKCNLAKANRPVEEFLKDRPELLQRILNRLGRSDLASAAHVNTVLPYLVKDLQDTGLPVALTDAASVSWARRQLNVPKTHCYDAALQGRDFSSVVSLPSPVLALRPNNGCSKQKANVDKHGTPIGRPFRAQQRLPKHLRRRNPAAGHSDKRQRHGPKLIATGDTVRLAHQSIVYTGRGVIKSAGTRVAIHGTKPQVSAKIEQCRRLARNPGWTIRRSVLSQQSHAPNKVQQSHQRLRTRRMS